MFFDFREFAYFQLVTVFNFKLDTGYLRINNFECRLYLNPDNHYSLLIKFLRNQVNLLSDRTKHKIAQTIQKSKI